ncbi:4Fe-4S dicluster domain-containing protein [Natranaerofaba carboxydovora]|uniref:4Fe-4S dicluster domain-containing protein n=1 Tax=Natranaerofaba carboxydovora TaxID=2742683 RepID=UPI001F1354AE|nr:4Fe-4S dicluster domain-containing protein [Natranaerofaba carboxydovora]UMZ73774.1 4Fe-4S dicluster domain protein [Natranaerofaba carboxydovora]
MYKLYFIILGFISYYFINKLKGTHKNEIRPPGALPEDEFLAICARCGKCALACPYNSIEIASADKGLSVGTPTIIPQKQPCRLCNNFDCTKVCPTDALRPVKDKKQVKMGVAKTDRSKCNAWAGDECRVCYLSCKVEDAIELENYRRPVINEDECVGCGICEYVCVNKEPAVKIKP